MSSNEYAVIIPVPPHVADRFTDEQIEAAAMITFWTHPPPGFVVMEDPRIDWARDMLRGGRIVRAVGGVVPCN